MLLFMPNKTNNLAGSIYHNRKRGTYRFRYGRDGTTKTFKRKGQAVAYQNEFTQKLKANGTSALETIKASNEAKAAFELLAKHQLPPAALVEAVNLYIETTSPSSRLLTYTDALVKVMKTERFKVLSKGTQNDYRQRWQRLEKLAGEMKLAEITPSTLEGFLKKHCRSSTLHKFYVSLNVLWKTYFIGVTRLTKYNPLEEVEPPVRPASKRKEPYTCEEVFKLLDELDEPTINRNDIADLARMEEFPKLAVALNVAFYTGLRASEVCRLQLKDFFRGNSLDWKNHPYITLAADKTKEALAKRVLVPPCLVKYLRKNKYFNGLNSDERLFPHTPRTLRNAMKERCGVAKIPWKGSASSRTTFGTHAVDGLFDGDISRTARQLGHSTSDTSLKHYVNYAIIQDCKIYFQRGL
jgi:integrase